jgi:hypothetical protein
MGSNDTAKAITGLDGEPLLDAEELDATNTERATWYHPTGGAPRSVTLLGLGPTSQHYHTANFQYTPKIPATEEVWTLNKGGRTQRCDLLFVMDDLEGERLKAPSYFRDLMASPVPIITSRVDTIIERQVTGADTDAEVFEYPLAAVVDYCGERFNAARRRRLDRSDEILDRHGLPMSARGVLRSRGADPDRAGRYTNREAGLRTSYYFHNSLPYMLAYALFLETVETIHMFGCDYTYPGANIHEEDRANCEFWVGVCRANGIEVKVPEDTTLLSARKQPYAYGFGARQPVLE